MKCWRLFYRSILLLAHVVLGIVLTLLYRLFRGAEWFQQPSGKRVIRLWMRVLAMIFGLRVHVHGQAANGMLVANHVSWLDIVSIDSVLATRFVAKDDVKRWPVAGQLSGLSGTFFLRRGSAAAVNSLNRQIQQALQQGATVGAFPEGTTSDGQQILKFHAALLQPAITIAYPIQPVAIRYMRAGTPDELAPFLEESFMRNALRMLQQGTSEVHLYFGDRIDTAGQQRKALANLCRERIVSALEEAARLNGPGNPA